MRPRSSLKARWRRGGPQEAAPLKSQRSGPPEAHLGACELPRQTRPHLLRAQIVRGVLMSDAARARALRTTLLQRSDAWKAAADRARRLASARTDDVNDAAKLVDDYRLL